MSKTPYKAEQARLACAGVLNGVPLRAIAEEDGMPGWPAISDWLLDRPSFRARVARARQLHADTLVDDLIQIARQLGTEGAAGAADLACAKLRIDTLKWVIGHCAAEVENDVRKPDTSAKPQRPAIIKVVTGVPRRIPDPPD